VRGRDVHFPRSAVPHCAAAFLVVFMVYMCVYIYTYIHCKLARRLCTRRFN
jgi:hypothetical protein